MATKCHWLLLPGLSGVAVELGLSNLHTVGVKERDRNEKMNENVQVGAF